MIFAALMILLLVGGMIGSAAKGYETGGAVGILFIVLFASAIFYELTVGRGRGR